MPDKVLHRTRKSGAPVSSALNHRNNLDKKHTISQLYLVKVFRWDNEKKLNNPDFKTIEFDGFKKKAGLNSFILTAKQWIEKTNAIGLIEKFLKLGAQSG